MVDATACFSQRRDVVAHAELDAIGHAARGQFAGEPVGIARFVFGGVGGTGELRANVAQRGLQPYRFVGRNHLAFAAQLAHLLRGRFRCIELFLAGIEVQDALRALVVLQA